MQETLAWPSLSSIGLSYLQAQALQTTSVLWSWKANGYQTSHDTNTNTNTTLAELWIVEVVSGLYQEAMAMWRW